MRKVTELMIQIVELGIHGPIVSSDDKAETDDGEGDDNGDPATLGKLFVCRRAQNGDT
jgi:hypothetical protein